MKETIYSIFENLIITIARNLIPRQIHKKIGILLLEKKRRYHLHTLRFGRVQFGNLRKLRPISRAFGSDRGLPIDRYYIKRFLFSHVSDIKGHVLEMGDNSYTKMFGGHYVDKSDVLNIAEGNQKTTIVADLTCADHIPSNTFDCIIFTQTLQMIYDMKAALRHLQRILKPGGVLLVTSHGISRIGRREGIDPWGEYWRITTQSAKKLFQSFFKTSNIKIKAYGNVLTAVAFLEGVAAEELTQEELDYCDPDYEVLVTIRAVKD